MEIARRPSYSTHFPEEMALSWHLQSCRWAVFGGGSALLCSLTRYSQGWSGSELPNAFQKTSCKWPRRVIHVKLIKPLLVS